MLRPSILVLAATALLAVGPVVTPAAAVSSLAYVFVVPCASPTPTASLVGMASGTYAVAVAGVCLLRAPGDNTLCSIALPKVNTNTGGNCLPTLSGCLYSVAVDGQCVIGAGTIHHSGNGAMTAVFLDDHYQDNVGDLVVTVTWTPL